MKETVLFYYFAAYLTVSQHFLKLNFHYFSNAKSLYFINFIQVLQKFVLPLKLVTMKIFILILSIQFA